MSKKLFHNIGKLYTMEGGCRTKSTLNDARIYENAFMICEHGLIVAIGKNYPNDNANYDEIIDLKQACIIPGLIDAHTHLVHCGNRSNEYTMKINGVSYLDILKSGGGILASVKATRGASFDDLYCKAQKTLHTMLRKGVTCVEAKSGYGLNYESELKQLKVVAKLQQNLPQTLVSTFMPAHALEDGKEMQTYIDEICNEMLPAIASSKLASFMDVFLDKGVYNSDQAYQILMSAQKYGLKAKLHIDEIEDIGGCDTAIRVNATSVDHCMVLNATNALRLANNNIPIVLLPATSFNLQKPYADIEVLLDASCVIALASDYNPGSCPCDDIIFVMRLASRVMHLLPNEVLAMTTINAAKALDLQATHGSLEKGKRADFVVLNIASFDEVIASLETFEADAVYIKGEKVC